MYLQDKENLLYYSYNPIMPAVMILLLLFIFLTNKISSDSET